jgi:hypothetical protein
MDANLIKNLIKNLEKDLIELMSDAEEEQCYEQCHQDEANNAISVENIISFSHEHSDRIKKEIDNPNFQDLFDRRLEMKITCFDNFWEELDSGK